MKKSNFFLISSILIFILLNINKIATSENVKRIELAQINQVPDDKRFIDKNFSQSLFWQVPQYNGCEFYRLGHVCAYQRQHFFKNGVLTIIVQGTAGVSINFQPQEDISIQEAINYAKLLTDGWDIRIDNPYVVTENYIRYLGIPYPGREEHKEEEDFLGRCDLITNDVKKIQEIDCSFGSP